MKEKQKTKKNQKTKKIKNKTKKMKKSIHASFLLKVSGARRCRATLRPTPTETAETHTFIHM